MTTRAAMQVAHQSGPGPQTGTHNPARPPKEGERPTVTARGPRSHEATLPPLEPSVGGCGDGQPDIAAAASISATMTPHTAAMPSAHVTTSRRFGTAGCLYDPGRRNRDGRPDTGRKPLPGHRIPRFTTLSSGGKCIRSNPLGRNAISRPHISQNPACWAVRIGISSSASIEPHTRRSR